MRKMTKRLNVRLSEEDFNQIWNNAETQGCSVAELIRRTAIRGGNAAPVTIDNQGIREVLMNLQRIGGNLNQLAHVMNISGMSAGDVERIEGLALELKAADREVRKLVADIRAGRYNI